MSSEVLEHPPNDPTAYAVEWHRPDPRRRLYKAWIAGSLILVGGAAVLAQVIGAADSFGPVTRLLLVVLSVALSAAGPLLVVITAIRALADDTCLVLRSDGIHYIGNDDSFFVRWRDVVAATYDEQADAMRIETESDVRSVVHPQFLGMKSQELVKRVDDIRRRALLGLIRPATVWGWEEGRH